MEDWDWDLRMRAEEVAAVWKARAAEHAAEARSAWSVGVEGVWDVEVEGVWDAGE